MIPANRLVFLCLKNRNMQKERLLPSAELALMQSQAQTLEKLGLWAGSNKDKFAFRLSPDSLELTRAQKDELEEINELIFGQGGFMQGALALFDKTFDPRFTSNPSGGKVARTLSLGTPKCEKEILQTFRSQVPALVRLDLALTGAGNTSFKILEVEGDKTHAFGYATMTDMFAGESALKSGQLPGLIEVFRQILKKNMVPKEKSVALIVGRSEMFYEQELGIFANLAQASGVNIIMLPERDVQVTDKGISPKDGSFPHVKNNFITDTLVNLPILTPAGERGTGIGAELLLRLFAEAKISCLIPPKRFLGSKGLLALVSNGDNDKGLETVLEECFDSQKITRLREFIPQTFVISKKSRPFASAELDDDPGRWVIKKSVSSGMKGVALPEGNRQRSMLGEAIQNPYNFVMQKKVDQETREFRFSEPDNLNQIKKARMFMRISPFCTPNGIATISVTCRETPDVHGSRDSIQIPVIFKD